MNYELFLRLCNENVNEKVYKQVDSKDGYVKMKALAGENTYLVREKLIYLQKKIIYEHIVNGRQLEPFITYVYVLLDGVRDNSVTKEQGESSSIRWADIISVLGEIKDTNMLMKAETNFESLHAKLFDFGNACSRLIKKGFSIVEEKDDFYFDESCYHQLTLEIDRLALSVGGCNILHAIFEVISKQYDCKQKRFHIFRNLSMGNHRPSPEIPLAYLIALGAKHSNILGNNSRVESFPMLIELLKDIVSVFEVQDYSPYESWHVDHYSLTNFLSDEIIFDNLFCISQINSKHAREILQYVITSIEFKQLRSHGFSINKIYECGSALLNHSLEKQIIDLDFETAKKILRLGKANATRMIEKILLNPNPNKNLEFPPKSLAIDSSFTQLLPFKGSYLLMPEPLSSLAFLNNTLNSIIAPDGKRSSSNDNTLGLVIEAFVKSKLDSYGIEYYSGDYRSIDGSLSGETDITIETDSAIIFIEIKKKGMTRLSMSGFDYSILSDLGEGLIHATSQCFKAERILRCDGILNIDNSKKVNYESQRVIKVALTLYDYGSLQDKMAIRSILNSSLSASFKANELSADKKLNKWREHINEISEHISKLDEAGQLDEEPFHNLFFMSIPQLLMILEDQPSGKGLEKTLRTLSSLSHSTRDFYKEYSLSKTYIQ